MQGHTCLTTPQSPSSKYPPSDLTSLQFSQGPDQRHQKISQVECHSPSVSTPVRDADRERDAELHGPTSAVPGLFAHCQGDSEASQTVPHQRGLHSGG